MATKKQAKTGPATAPELKEAASKAAAHAQQIRKQVHIAKAELKAARKAF